MSSQVEQVLSRAAVSSAWALFPREVSETMLDDNTFAEMFASGGRSDLLSQLLLERLVFCDADLAAVVEGATGAEGALWTLATVRGSELDRGSELEGPLFSVRARDDLPWDVDEEGALREEASVGLRPRLAHDCPPGI